MVILKSIAEHYASKLKVDPLRMALGRKGSALSSGEDSDMAFCACDLGYAVGVFPQLSLLHLMPRGRLDRNYLLRLVEGMAFSHAVLRYLWDDRLPGELPRVRRCRSQRLLDLYKTFRGRMRKTHAPSFEEDYWRASEAGTERARCFIEEFRRGSETRGRGNVSPDLA
jgi:hypothetical protein